MEPDVRFCTTSDGVSIAYTSYGDGPPLVDVLGWASHVEFSARMPGIERSLGRLLARNRHYYTYDGRGFGLSDRDVTDFGLDARIRDLEAVVDASELDHFDLMGVSGGGPTAIAYANRHRDRVRRLVIYGASAHMVPPETEAEKTEMKLRLMAIIPGWGKDTPEFRQLWTMQFMPGGSPELIEWFNEMQRRSAAATTVTAFLGALV
ncbi:MAG: alpha/beta hydrolase [Chloroflexi bacterium]|nr:alpha/beta hydrolase [Chloroflexota bacterium]